MKIGDIRLGRFAVAIAAVYILSVVLLVGLAWGLDFESWMPTWIQVVIGAVFGFGTFRLGIPLLRPWYTESSSLPPSQWTEDNL